MSPKKRNPAGSTARQVVNEAYKKGSKDVVERVTCQVYSRRELAEKTLSWAFSMVELNVKEFYGDSWSPREKQRELKSDHAQFIFHEDDRGVRDGFASFRFCVEDDEAILYIYELQVDEKVRGKGIGKHMLKLLEEVAAHMKMSKVILTVHKSNERAIAFYRSQGLSVDESSPSRWGHSMPYEIMSKKVAAEQPGNSTQTKRRRKMSTE